ncbi:MAG: hypothetical protein JXB32_19290 [Deltaproteobacteria bacterium]|nr:hypothetical protein [Deltaproteobacteria bacterium]
MNRNATARWLVGLAALVAGATTAACDKRPALPPGDAGAEPAPAAAGSSRSADAVAPDVVERDVAPVDTWDGHPGDAEGPLAHVPHASCELGLAADGDSAWIFFSPARPVAGAPLRVIGVAERDLDDPRLVLDDGRERKRLGPVEAWGGPPWGWSAAVSSPSAGPLELCLSSRDRPRHACVKLEVAAEADPSRAVPATGIWPIERAWDRGWEDFYQVWIARLFLVEPGMTLGWHPLHKALYDPTRNLLHGHLGLGEDDPAAVVPAELAPDCGDAPYFLRAYFAWKHRLPFAAHVCKRGEPGVGPECTGEVLTNLAPAWDQVEDPVLRLNRFLAETLARLVHSGTTRSLVDAEVSDFYPLPLSRAALRPGTIFVDPRGHVLILTRWLPGRRDRIGTLYAIDGHPDQSISHKRYARTNYFFTIKTTSGGFKAFRPLAYIDGRFCFASNAELAEAPPAAQYSTEQYRFADAEAWHAHLEQLLNPEPLEPLLVFRDRLQLLVELLAERETAVRVAFEYMEQSGWAAIPIPSGPAIFTTSGPWEDYSSPGRDLRLLAMADEVLGFPAQVEENAGAFAIPAGKTPAEVRAELEAEWLAARDALGIDVRRSDGTMGRLTLGVFVERLRAFELAYHPNDCPEVRWGASESDPEYATCVHRAPAAHRRLMEGYRLWFTARRLPGIP